MADIWQADQHIFRLQPGEICVIEQERHSALSPLHRAALNGANVVLYDRALAALVAATLPLGGYAEPLAVEAAGRTIAARALQFAAEGWSVVQIVEARAGRSERFCHAIDELARNQAEHLPVRIFRKATLDREPASDATLHGLPERLAEIADGDPLTIVLGPVAIRYAAHGAASTANGLAG